MLARKQEIQLQVNQFADALLLGASLWFAYLLRENGIVVVDQLPDIPSFSEFFWMLAVIIPFGPFMLELQGFYQYPLEKSTAKSLRQMAGAGLWLVVLLGLCVIFLKLAVPSRSVLLIFGVMAPVLLLLRERLFAEIYRRQLRNGKGGEKVLLAGEPKEIEQLVASFTPTQKLEIQIVEQVDFSKQGVEDLVKALHRNSVGRVLFAFSTLQLDLVQKAIEACELEGVEAWLSADFIRTSVARPTYETLGRHPMLVFRATPEISWAMLAKASIDRVGAFVMLVALSPLLLVVALLVKCTSPGPILFNQKRAGRYGQPFTMWKFRSMVLDAEARRAELETHNEMSGPVFKIHKDPRITSIGHWLRKTSIDELPQLINVLCGDMSLVGPRPLPVYEVEKFESRAHRRRLSMKPGLTCIWQIRGRNEVTNFDDWVKMDLEYIDNWSLALDFSILLRTIPVVLFGKGAK